MIPQNRGSVSDVSARTLLKCIRCNPDDAVVCIANKENLKNFAHRDVVLDCPNLVYGDFSSNNFTRCDLWNHFPDLWWVDLTNNNLVTESLTGLARVIGKLHLTNNIFNHDGKLSPESIKLLSKSHILRLKWSHEVPSSEIVEKFPYAAVINDNFIRHQDRKHSSLYDSSGNDILLFNKDGIKDAHTNTEGAIPNGEWLTQLPGVRDINYFRAIQTIPANKSLADYFLMDMVLEDYLEEARLANKYAADNNITGYKRTPTVNIEEVMHLPHKQRNDMAVLLTATMLYPELPVQIVEDAFIVLLIHFFDADAIKDLMMLPSFVKAGVVSVIKRVCLKELQEIHFSHRLLDKPRCSLEEMLQSEYKLVLLRAAARVSSAIRTKDDLNNLNNNSNVHNRTTVLCPTFLDSDGFYHLRSFKLYINKVFDSGESDMSDIHSGEGTLLDHKEHDVTDGFNEHFTALEMEILANLPNIPSAMDRPLESDLASSSYSDNISFISRHAVLLLTKSPACPSLVRPQNSLPKQDAYRALLFMLKFAKMTYGDMEITQVGPDKDGRCKSPSKRRAGGNKEEGIGESVSTVSKKGQLKLSATVGGNVLAFGSGIAGGSPSDFFWNTEQFIEKRQQEKKWEKMEETRLKQEKLMQKAAAANANAMVIGNIGGAGVNISIPQAGAEGQSVNLNKELLMESASLEMMGSGIIITHSNINNSSSVDNGAGGDDGDDGDRDAAEDATGGPSSTTVPVGVDLVLNSSGAPSSSSFLPGVGYDDSLHSEDEGGEGGGEPGAGAGADGETRRDSGGEKQQQQQQQLPIVSTPSVPARVPGESISDIREGLSRGGSRTSSPVARSHLPHAGAHAGAGSTVSEVMRPIPSNSYDFKSLPTSPSSHSINSAVGGPLNLGSSSSNMTQMQQQQSQGYGRGTIAAGTGSGSSSSNNNINGRRTTSSTNTTKPAIGANRIPLSMSNGGGTIHGFSNDFADSASFLLASKHTAQCYNQAAVQHIRQATHVHRAMDTPAVALWDNLEHPPVEILPSTVLKFEQDSSLLIDTWGHIQEEKDRVCREVALQQVSNENSFISASIDIGGVVVAATATAAAASNSSDGDDVSPAVLDLNREQIGVGMEEQEEILPSDAHMQLQRQLTITEFNTNSSSSYEQGRDLGLGLEDGLLAGMNQSQFSAASNTTNTTNTSKQSHQQSQASYESYYCNGKPVRGSETVAEATRRLLAEMGTLRNVRSLNDSKRLQPPPQVGRMAGPNRTGGPQKRVTISSGGGGDTGQADAFPQVKYVLDSEDAVLGDPNPNLGANTGPNNIRSSSSSLRFSWGGPFPTYPQQQQQSQQQQQQQQGDSNGCDKQVTFLTISDTVEGEEEAQEEGSGYEQQLTPPHMPSASMLLPPQSAPDTNSHLFSNNNITVAGAAATTAGGAGVMSQVRTMSVSELRSHVSTSAVNTLQHHLGYDHISVIKDVEMGQQTAAGGACGSGGTWYPLQKKVHYTMDSKKTEDLLEKRITSISQSLLAEMQYAQEAINANNNNSSNNGIQQQEMGLEQYLHSAGTRDLKSAISKLKMKPKAEVKVKAKRYEVKTPAGAGAGAAAAVAGLGGMGTGLSVSVSTGRLLQMSGAVKLTKKALAAASDAQIHRPLITLPKTTVGRMTKSLSVAAADFTAGCHPGGHAGAQASGVVFPPISKLPIQNATSSKILHQQMPIPRPVLGSNAGSPTHSLRASPTHSGSVSLAGAGVSQQPQPQPQPSMEGMIIDLSFANSNPNTAAMSTHDDDDCYDDGDDQSVSSSASVKMRRAQMMGVEPQEVMPSGLPGLSDDLDSLPESIKSGHVSVSVDVSVSVSENIGPESELQKAVSLGSASSASNGGDVLGSGLDAREDSLLLSQDPTSSLIGDVRTFVRSASLMPPSRQASNVSSIGEVSDWQEDGNGTGIGNAGPLVRGNRAKSMHIHSSRTSSPNPQPPPNILIDGPKTEVISLIKPKNSLNDRDTSEMFVLQGSGTQLASNMGGGPHHGGVGSRGASAKSAAGGAATAGTRARSKTTVTVRANPTTPAPAPASSLSHRQSSPAQSILSLQSNADGSTTMFSPFSATSSMKGRDITAKTTTSTTADHIGAGSPTAAVNNTIHGGISNSNNNSNNNEDDGLQFMRNDAGEVEIGEIGGFQNISGLSSRNSRAGSPLSLSALKSPQQYVQG